MGVVRFDLSRLYAAIDTERQHRGLTWAALAREVGVSTSTIRRYQEADDAEADGVLLAVRWLGQAPEDYVTNGSVKRKLLPTASNGYVRVDMERVAIINGDSSGAKGKTRTTIQRLINISQSANQPVATLTRITKI